MIRTGLQAIVAGLFTLTLIVLLAATFMAMGLPARAPQGQIDQSDSTWIGALASWVILSGKRK